MQKNYHQNIKEAVRHLKIADHMIYVTFPLVNERRMVLKIFDEIYLTVINCISAVLNYEFELKKIQLYKNPEDNLETFFKKCSRSYDLDVRDITLIKEILELEKKHKQSAIEFVKKEKIVIMSDNLETRVINLNEIKKYLLVSKEFFLKVNKKIS